MATVRIDGVRNGARIFSTNADESPPRKVSPAVATPVMINSTPNNGDSTSAAT